MWRKPLKVDPWVKLYVTYNNVLWFHAKYFKNHPNLSMTKSRQAVINHPENGLNKPMQLLGNSENCNGIAKWGLHKSSKEDRVVDKLVQRATRCRFMNASRFEERYGDTTNWAKSLQNVSSISSADLQSIDFYDTFPLIACIKIER